MARINTYSSDTSVQKNDKLLGSNANGTTRNFSIKDIGAFQANTNSAAIIGQLPYVYHNNSFGGNSSRQAGSITINTNDDTTAFSSVTTLKLSKTPSGYASDVVAVLTAFLNKDIIISSNDDPNNFATYKCTAVTQDSSETDFYDLSLTYIAGNGNLEVGEFYSTSRDISTSENTTYDISIPSGTTSFRLTGSDASTDDIVVSGSGGVTVSRTSANILDISSVAEQYTGTVTSVSGTGTVSGLTLSGTVTSSGSLTLGGSLTLTSNQITTGLGFTPYNATNPNGYTSFAEPGIFSGGGSPTLASGVTAAEVRTLIGAGTSSLVLGTSSSTALAGDTTTISGSQASAISANTSKVSDTGAPAILSEEGSPSLNTGITAAEVRTLIGAGTSNTTGTVTGTGTTNYLSKFTGSSAIGDSIVFDNGTSVGIGTTSPDHTLRVNGDARLGNLHIKTSHFGTGGTGKSIHADSAGSGVLGFTSTTQFDFSNGSTSVMRINSSGNVGIGTNSPSKKLTVRTSAASDGVYLETSQPVTYTKIYNSNSESFPVGNLNLAYGSTDSASIQALSNRMSLKGGYTTGGQISFLSASTEIMRVTATGLGIGTTSPSAKLEVVGGNIKGDGLIQVENVSDNNIIGKLVIDYGAANVPTLTSVAGTEIEFAADLVMRGNNNIYSDTSSSLGLKIGSQRANTPIKFVTSPTTNLTYSEAMRIAGDGKVGIGTTSPAQALDVHGIIQISNTYKQYILQSHNTYGNLLVQQSGATTIPLTINAGTLGIGVGNIGLQSALNVNGGIAAGTYYNTAAPSNGMIISGNVGIGITSPSAKLHAKGTGTTSATTALLIEDSAGSNLLRVRDDGKVTINGTEDELLTLNVTDNGPVFMSFERNSNRHAYVGFGGSSDNFSITNEEAGHITMSTGGGEKMRIESGGDTGIGTTSPSAKLNVRGTGATSATTALLVENSSGTDLLKVYDDGATTTKHWSINSDGEISSSTLSGGGDWLNFGSAGGAGFLFTNNGGVLSLKTSGQVFRTEPTNGGKNATRFRTYYGGGVPLTIESVSGQTGNLTEWWNSSGTPTTVIDASGNAGIGTQTPLAKLHVFGGDMYLGSGQYGNDWDTTQRRFRLYTNTNTSPYLDLAAAATYATASSTFFRTSVQGAASGRYSISVGNGNVNTNSGEPSSFSEAFTILNNRNVGIGTTSPIYKLDVAGDVRTQGWFYATTQGVRVKNGSAASPTLGFADDIDMGMYRANTNTLGFSTGAVERMRINSSGNVGIGTTSPDYLFEVEKATSGSATLASFKGAENTAIRISRTGADSGTSYLNVVNNGALYTSSDSHLVFQPGNSTSVFLRSDGNVGIGTTNPAGLLSVSDGTYDTLRVQNGTSHLAGTRLYRLDSEVGSSSAWMLSATGNSIVIGPRTGTTQFTVVDTSENAKFIVENGNVGIGTTSPALQSGGTGLHISASTSSELKFTNSTTGTGAADGTALVSTGTGFTINNREAGYISFGTSNSTRLRISSAGKVGIGTTSPINILTVKSASDNSFPFGVLASDGSYLSYVSEVSGNGEFNVASGSGVSRVKLNSSGNSYFTGGNVGIGTTSPAYPLHVNGQGLFGAAFASGFYLSPSNLTMYIGGNSSLSKSAASLIVGGANYTGLLFRQTAGYVIRTDSNGQVNIGGSAPTAKLTVTGRGTTSSTINLQLKNSSSAELLRVRDDGQVGVGTTSPVARLHVKGAGVGTSKALNIENSAGTQILSVYDSGQVVAIGPGGNSTTNTVIGFNAMQDNTGGTRNTAFGNGALANAVACSYNTAIGVDALVSLALTGGNTYNTAVGFGALANVTSAGYGNVAIGSLAGATAVGGNYTGGTGSIYIGHTAQAGATGATNEVVIGFGAVGAGHNTVTIGRSSTANTYLNGVLNVSDIAADDVIVTGSVGIGTTSPASKLHVAGGIQLADDGDTASATKVGTIRYRTSGNNSYVDMCMQTGASTYAWVNIVQNNW